jgi:hypothetical protein
MNDVIEFAIETDEARKTVTITMTVGGRSTQRKGSIDEIRDFAYHRFDAIMKQVSSLTCRNDVKTVKNGVLDYLAQVEAHFKTLN